MQTILDFNCGSEFRVMTTRFICWVRRLVMQTASVCGLENELYQSFSKQSAILSGQILSPPFPWSSTTKCNNCNRTNYFVLCCILPILPRILQGTKFEAGLWNDIWTCAAGKKLGTFCSPSLKKRDTAAPLHCPEAHDRRFQQVCVFCSTTWLQLCCLLTFCMFNFLNVCNTPID